MYQAEHFPFNAQQILLCEDPKWLLLYYIHVWLNPAICLTSGCRISKEVAEVVKGVGEWTECMVLPTPTVAAPSGATPTVFIVCATPTSNHTLVSLPCVSASCLTSPHPCRTMQRMVWWDPQKWWRFRWITSHGWMNNWDDQSGWCLSGQMTTWRGCWRPPSSCVNKVHTVYVCSYNCVVDMPCVVDALTWISLYVHVYG